MTELERAKKKIERLERELAELTARSRCQSLTILRYQQAMELVHRASRTIRDSYTEGMPKG